LKHNAALEMKDEETNCTDVLYDFGFSFIYRLRQGNLAQKVLVLKVLNLTEVSLTNLSKMQSLNASIDLKQATHEARMGLLFDLGLKARFL